MLNIRIFEAALELGARGAALGASAIRAAIAKHGEASIIVATGVSQYATLAALVQEQGIDWSRVTVFHLDEYVGLPQTHKASFRGYLQQRFLAPLRNAPHFVPVQGDAVDIAAEVARLNGLIAGRRIDVCFAGIGENCHLAFNDPPADFDTDVPFLVVTLDDACRRQQWGEGWFETLEAVPTKAISMSIRQILRSQLLVVSALDLRKAEAVRATVEGAVSPLYPASILQTHDNAVLLLDRVAASLLRSVPEAVA